MRDSQFEHQRFIIALYNTIIRSFFKNNPHNTLDSITKDYLNNPWYHYQVVNSRSLVKAVAFIKRVYVVKYALS